MKNITARILIIAFVVIALTACGKKEGKQAEASSQPTAATSSANETYEAIFTCGMGGAGGGENLNILACFAGGSASADTELEIKNGDQYGMYKAYNLSSVGSEDSHGFHIQLKNHFAIKAQNSHSTLILGLKIVDSSGKVVFQKSASQYGVISVQN